MSDRRPPPEVVTLGRIGVDLYPEQLHTPLEDVCSFRKLLGGSPANVAVATARYGHRTAMCTLVGDDGFGRFLRAELERLGVDASGVRTHPELRTPLAFCEIHPPDHFPLLFYREPRAPDLDLSPEDLDGGLLAGARVIWTTGTALGAEPSRSTTLAAMAAGGDDATVIHDIDHRPSLWASEDRAAAAGRAALERASVVVGNREEAALLVGGAAPDELARRLLQLGPRLAVIKLGPAGVLAVSADCRVVVEPVPVTVINGLGAGDAFGGALIHGLLSDWPLQLVMEFANAAGAVVAGRFGCAVDMPSDAEVQRLMADAGRPIAGGRHTATRGGS